MHREYSYSLTLRRLFCFEIMERMAENTDNSSDMIHIVVRSPKESKDIVVNGRDTVKQVYSNVC